MVAAPAVMVPVPSEVVPRKNWTVPVGVPTPAAAAEMVAVRATLWPKTGEAGVVVTTAVVEACPTVSIVGEEVWPVKLVSPEYVAVIELLPSASPVAEMLPTPPESVAVPSDVVPLKNWTVPVGVPAPGLTAETVAERVMVCPNTGVVVDGVNVVNDVACPTVTVVGGEEVLGA